MPNSPPPLVVIIGPTAVGKTEISIQLARRLDGEIVSADSRLFYRGMDIGTAKPALQQRGVIPHHLVDVADPGQTWSLAQFQRAAISAIADIHSRHKLPFLVGGTGQYIHAVVHGWEPPPQPPNPSLRTALERLAENHGREWLHERLKYLDPLAAGVIDPRNLRRSIRALEVILSTGRRFSDQRLKKGSPYRVIQVGLTRPRAVLYARIDERIESMFSSGLLEEVESLLHKGYSPDLPAFSAIGYRECIAVLQGLYGVEEAKTRMKRVTRVYVRRQANWFKSNDPSIAWFSIEEDIVHLIECYLRSLLI